MNVVNRTIANVITVFTRVLTGARARWIGCAPEDVKRVYFANHASHADFALLWASLPPRLRVKTRPVAGADYWLKGGLRSYLIQRVLNGVLVARSPKDHPEHDSTKPLVAALDAGDSLILFPEGTRNCTGECLLPFKSGIFHLAAQRPEVELVPVWMDNPGRVLPKGESVPLPVLCTVSFGTPLRIHPDETKFAFIDRARRALLELSAAVNASQEVSV